MVVRLVLTMGIVGLLTACPTTPMQPLPKAPVASAVAQNANLHTKSRWMPADWSDLPGFENDNLSEAWVAWRHACERPPADHIQLCRDINRLQSSNAPVQREWMRERLQPYRIESLDGQSEGLLTSYYEPILDASRKARPGFTVPLYRPPASLATRKPWYTRQEMDTLPEARAALAGLELAYVANPLDAMMLQIQGSGTLRLTESDGSVRQIRAAYAGTNSQPYKGVGAWLLSQGATRDATWPGIKAWVARNPQRLNALLWANPRVAFFKEENVQSDGAIKGAQGVALTAGRSLAVDRDSIPYGTPLWMVSTGSQINLQKLVFAQDTGSAITGAVRADYFAGQGPQAGELAGRLKQPLRLWVLWPK